jgi:hypothetical protein
LSQDERFVSLIHLGQPIQGRVAPERAAVADTVAYLP